MAKSVIKKIGIVGMGFMGGSLALALKRRIPGVSISGYARSKKSYDRLKKLNIAHRVERNLEKVVRNSDVVVLAAPVEAIVDYIKRIKPFLKEGAVVFDLGSSKKRIHNAADKYLSKDISFVGCHPLCGSEKSGAEFACENLYEGAVCLITSSPNKRGIDTVKKIWLSLGSKVVFMDIDFHDKILSCVSHLPHLISFSLTHFVPKEYLKFSGGSFKDLTRISNSPAPVWADIFISNRKNILKDLAKFKLALKEFEILLKKADRDKISKLIKKVNIKQKAI